MQSEIVYLLIGVWLGVAFCWLYLFIREGLQKAPSIDPPNRGESEKDYANRVVVSGALLFRMYNKFRGKRIAVVAVVNEGTGEDTMVIGTAKDRDIDRIGDIFKNISPRS